MADTNPTSGKTILMCGYPGGWSHYFQQLNLARELVTRGYHIVFLRDDSTADNPKFDYSGIQDVITYPLCMSWDEWLLETGRVSRMDPAAGTARIVELQKENGANMIAAAMPKLKEMQIDLAVVDSCIFSFICIVESLGLPHIDYCPVGYYEPFGSFTPGLDIDLSCVPVMGSGCWNKMDKYQQITNTFFYHANMFTYIGIFDDQEEWRLSQGFEKGMQYAWQQKCIKRLYPVPAPLEFRKELPECDIFARHLTPKPGKPLTGEFKSLVDKFDAFAVFSLGTLSITDHESLELDQKVVDAAGMSGIPIIMKSLDSESLGKILTIPENMHEFEWLPQQDLLAHPKCKLFITHCGMNGLVETAYHGVKSILLPRFADQFDNAARTLQVGTGEKYDIKTETAESLAEHIKALWANEEMQQRAYELSRQLKAEWFDLPEPADFIDDALKNGFEAKSTHERGKPTLPAHFMKFCELAGIEYNDDDIDKQAHFDNMMALMAKMQSEDFASLVDQAYDACEVVG